MLYFCIVFQKDVKKFVQDLPPEKRYAVLLHDEMSVRGDLVYDKRGGEIIGFVNPETWSFKQVTYTSLVQDSICYFTMYLHVQNTIRIIGSGDGWLI